MHKSKEREKEYNRIYYQSRKEEIKKHERERYYENREAKLEDFRNYYQNNIEKLKERNRQYHINNNRQEYHRNRYLQDPEKYKAKSAEIRRRQPAEYKRDRQNRWVKQKMSKDPIFKLLRLLRNSVLNSLKTGKVSKTLRTVEYLGCSIQDFRSYIISKFKTGMSIENHGKKWELDHIIPCWKFDLTLFENQLKCLHYTNLQPLWIADHRKKTAKEATERSLQRASGRITLVQADKIYQFSDKDATNEESS